MINTHQMYTYNDLRNFTYVIELENKEALVLDPWDAEESANAVRSKGLSLKAIINTHEHWDHTRGNEALVAEFGCEVWAHKNGEGKIPALTRTLSAGETITLSASEELKVLDTPGHTFAHLCFLTLQDGVPQAVFTGDTLFNAGVGNCHNGGSPDALYETIAEQFHTLPDGVLVYPGHDYLANNLAFTLSLEPSNEAAKSWLARVEGVDPGKTPVVTSIGDERTFNAFFRLDNGEIQASLELIEASDREVFLALRAKRNHW